jgi:hypothetical protein
MGYMPTVLSAARGDVDPLRIRAATSRRRVHAKRASRVMRRTHAPTDAIENVPVDRAVAPFAHADSGASIPWMKSTISAGALVGDPAS